MADQNIKVNINLDVTEFNKNAKAMSDALSNVLGKEIKLFTDELGQAETALNGTEQAIKGVGTAATKTGEGLKQSNKQWNNLSLVIQDLPYGFRGIQNNLPALAAGFAAVTGPIYLAVSALIAIWTAFGDEITKTIFKTSEAANQNKMVSDSFKSVESSVVQASVSVDKINFMIDQAKQGFVSKDKVVKTYNETLGKTIGQQSSFNGVVDAMQSKGQKYIELVTMMSFANALAAQSAKEAFTALMAEAKAPEEALGSIQKFGKGALSSVEYLINSIRGKTGELTPISDALYGAVGTVEKGKEVQAATKNVTFIESFLKNVKSQISKFAEENQFNLFDFGDEKTGKLDTTNLELLKKQQKYYKDDLDIFYYYGGLIIAEEERLAIKKAEIEGKSQEEIARIRKGFQTDMIINQQEYGRAIMAIADKNTKEYEKNEEEIGKIILKTREDIRDALNKINKGITDDEIKKIKDALAIKLRLNRNNVNLQVKNYEEALKKLEAERQKLIDLDLPTAQIDEEINSTKNKLEALGTTWDQTAQGISNVISGVLADSFTMLGEHIGNLMTGDAIQGIEQFQKMLANALINIGKMLISYGTLLSIAFAAPDPLVAIAAGVAAVALGTAIKNMANKQAVSPTAFANGGIVSGPTMGLVGEYPGAQNNPEVIAPLDKLKDMLGGGSGQFVLRGQDLVLAMQRSNTSLNIRRG